VCPAPSRDIIYPRHRRVTAAASSSSRTKQDGPLPVALSFSWVSARKCQGHAVQLCGSDPLDRKLFFNPFKIIVNFFDQSVSIVLVPDMWRSAGQQFRGMPEQGKHSAAAPYMQTGCQTHDTGSVPDRIGACHAKKMKTIQHPGRSASVPEPRRQRPDRHLCDRSFQQVVTPVGIGRRQKMVRAVFETRKGQTELSTVTPCSRSNGRTVPFKSHRPMRKLVRGAP